MKFIATRVAAAAIAATALAAPALAQSFRFGIDIGSRHEYRDDRYYGPRYDAPPYYLAPYGTYGPSYPQDCYTDSLNGRVCVD